MNKLREKFQCDDLNLSNLEAEQCEQITDDFAVNFSEFLDYYRSQHFDETTTTELLQIFKIQYYGKE